MSRFIKNLKDLTAGVLIIALAGCFAWQTTDLPMGTAIRMGPGYFPLLLSAVLGLLGAIVLFAGLRFTDDGPPINLAELPWRAVAAITLAVVVFGLCVRTLGLGPSIGLSVFISALGSRKFHLVTSLILTATMVGFVWLIFVKALGLPLPMLGPLLGGY